MSLDSTLRGLAAEIGQSRTPTGSVAAPAKLRHRTGTVTAYTSGDLTVSVQIGGDIVDAPFLATYSPTVGDAVSVLINNGSPLILGPVNKQPTVGAVIAAEGHFKVGDTSAFTGASYLAPFDTDRGSLPFPSPCFQANALGQGIDIIQDGYYLAHGSANISGAAPGDVFKLVISNGGGADGYGICYGIADSSGNVDLGASCAPSGIHAPQTPLFQVTVEQINGTGTTPTLGGVFIDMFQFGGNLLA